jgi:hypothetical protein
VNLLLPAQITRYNRRKDRSVTLTFETQEIPDISDVDEMVMREAFGVMYFRETEEGVLSEDELRELDAADLDLERPEKSPSKRLRSVLWLVFCESEPFLSRMDKEEKNKRFRDFYRKEMERIIEGYKARLD